MLPYCAHTLTSLALCSCAQLVIQIVCSTAAAADIRLILSSMSLQKKVMFCTVFMSSLSQ